MTVVARNSSKVVIVADSGTMRALLFGIMSDRLGFDVTGVAKEADEALELVGRTEPDVITIDLCLPYIDGSRLLAMLRDRAGLVKLVLAAGASEAVRERLVSLGASACLDRASVVRDPEAFRAGVLSALERHGVAGRQSRRVAAHGGHVIHAADRFPVPADEAGRLAALATLGAANLDPDPCLDMIARHLVGATGYPIAAVNLVDADTVWTRAAAGVGRGHSARAHHICAHAICQSGPLIVTDAAVHPFFSRLPVVTGEPYVRAYLGVPILSGGLPVGALCVADTRPRRPVRAQIAAVTEAAKLAAEFIADRAPRRLVA